MTAVLASGLMVASCSHGTPSQVVIADADTLQSAESNCSLSLTGQAQLRGAAAVIQRQDVKTVTRPKPGDRLRLVLWSGGLQEDTDLNSYAVPEALLDVVDDTARFLDRREDGAIRPHGDTRRAVV